MFLQSCILWTEKQRMVAPLIVVRFENDAHYNYVLGEIQSSGNYDYLSGTHQPVFDYLYQSSVYTSLQDGYNLVYPAPTVDKFFDGRHSFVLLDMTWTALWDSVTLGKPIPEMNILDSFPKFECYIFAYKNMGTYKSRMPHTVLKPYSGDSFYAPLSDSASVAIYDTYINVLNDIIVNHPEDMRKYCTTYIKDNEPIIDRKYY